VRLGALIVVILVAADSREADDDSFVIRAGKYCGPFRPSSTINAVDCFRRRVTIQQRRAESCARRAAKKRGGD
jgi:hypothetical protein